MAHKLLRHFSMAGGIMSLLALGVMAPAASAQVITANPTTGVNPESIATTPQKAGAPVNGVALGAGGLDPSRHIVINIGDSGFEKTSYTVFTTLGESVKSDIGTTEFRNTGTRTHGATAIPGSGYLRVSEDMYESCNKPHHGKQTCANDGTLDTGGIAPGQSVVVAHQYLGTAQIQSPMDCLNGNATPGFDCTAVTLTVKAAPLSNILNSSMEGTILHEADGSLSKVRTFNSVKGSPKAPLTGAVTVTIDDEKGFDPTTLWIVAGTNVTWVNNGQMVHNVRGRAPSPPTIDWVHLAETGGIGPGQSQSLFFECGIDPGCHHMGTGNSKFYSIVATDLIPNSANGASTSNGTDSRFMMRVAVVAAPA